EAMGGGGGGGGWVGRGSVGGVLSGEDARSHRPRRPAGEVVVEKRASENPRVAEERRVRGVYGDRGRRGQGPGRVLRNDAAPLRIPEHHRVEHDRVGREISVRARKVIDGNAETLDDLPSLGPQRTEAS